MQSKLSGSPKAIFILMMVRLSITSLLIIIGTYIAIVTPTEGFMGGLANAFYKRGLLIDDSYGAYNAGTLFSNMLLPLLLCLGIALSLKKRSKRVFFILIWVDLIMSFGISSMPLLPIIVLILAFQKSTRFWFQEKTEEFEFDFEKEAI